MVAGICFMKQLLLFILPSVTRYPLEDGGSVALRLLRRRRILVGARRATVVAVVISVAVGFYGIYHRVASSRRRTVCWTTAISIRITKRCWSNSADSCARSDDVCRRGDGAGRRHVMTMVGEPQNPAIIAKSGWLAFRRLLFADASVTVPVLVCGLLTRMLKSRKCAGFAMAKRCPKSPRRLAAIRRSKP